MTACQTLAKSLSATSLATSYPTTLFSLPPRYHYELTDLSSYTLYLFLYDKVLRRPVEAADTADIDRPLYDLCLHPGEWMAGVSVDEMVDAIQPNKADHD
jgi:hypothetical protein